MKQRDEVLAEVTVRLLTAAGPGGRTETVFKSTETNMETHMIIHNTFVSLRMSGADGKPQLKEGKI